MTIDELKKLLPIATSRLIVLANAILHKYAKDDVSVYLRAPGVDADIGRIRIDLGKVLVASGPARYVVVTGYSKAKYPFLIANGVEQDDYQNVCTEQYWLDKQNQFCSAIDDNLALEEQAPTALIDISGVVWSVPYFEEWYLTRHLHSFA